MRPLRPAFFIVLLSLGCATAQRRPDPLVQRVREDSLTLASLRAQLSHPYCPVDSAPKASIPKTSPTDSLLRARTAELTTLRAQLVSATAELARIKRRLSAPH